MHAWVVLAGRMLTECAAAFLVTNGHAVQLVPGQTTTHWQVATDGSGLVSGGWVLVRIPALLARPGRVPKYGVHFRTLSAAARVTYSLNSRGECLGVSGELQLAARI
jgi:hypothetical protein